MDKKLTIRCRACFGRGGWFIAMRGGDGSADMEPCNQCDGSGVEILGPEQKAA